MSLVILLSANSLGCERLSRQRHCAHAIEHINSTLAEIEPETDRALTDASAYLRIATLYEALDAKLETFGRQSPRLGEALASYREVVSDAAKAARAAAPAAPPSPAAIPLPVPAAPPSSRSETSRLLRKARVAESSALREIESYCHGS